MLLQMNWTRGATIGHGSSACVSFAVSRCSGEIFAVKSVELSRSEYLQKEQKILSTLSSPYIVGYKGYDVTREKNKDMFNLMMEYMPGGTLTDEIQREGGRLNEQLIGYYTKQIVHGLDYLHSSGIVHCDIKGRNILLSKSGAKIADFDCARSVDQAKWNGGTPMFMAPEVARGEEQGFAADIWALGCTIIEMATAASPWTTVNNNPASLLYHIAFSGQIPEIPKFLSSQARDFVGKCLRRDPKQRWSAKQLFKHPFLEEPNSYDTVNQDFITSSPTSILDQRIWNSPEESETVVDSTQTSSSMDSPLQRVTKLCIQSGKPEWRWDERWITVRNCSEDNRGDDGYLVSKMLEINCIDSLFCCSAFTVQHRAIISSHNFDRHIRSSVNKITQ